MALGTVIPSVIKAFTLLCQAAPELAAVTITDGYTDSENVGSYLMIGVEDPDAGDEASSATSTQDWAHATGGARNEVGAITCTILSWNGNGDPEQARTDAAAILEVVADLVRPLRKPSALGLPELLWVSFGDDLRLLQGMNESAVAAKFIFSLAFHARL